jgi:hypothetical protein
MSQDAWLITNGPLPAPISALASLYEDLWLEGRTFVTRDDLEGAEVNVNIVPLHRVPSSDGLELQPNSVAFNFSGRGFSHFHLPILEALAPRGGFFVYEDGDVEEIDPAAAPDLVLAATQATLAGDAASLERVLSSLPENDRYRLPLEGIARRVPALDPSWRETLGVPEPASHDARDAEQAVALADIQRRVEADEWAATNAPSPATARALVAQAIAGDPVAIDRLMSWAERYRSVGLAKRAERVVLGDALLDALEAAEETQRDGIIEYLEELTYWEGVERIVRVVKDADDYVYFIDELRELAETEMDRLTETDFGDL